MVNERRDHRYDFRVSSGVYLPRYGASKRNRRAAALLYGAIVWCIVLLKRNSTGYVMFQPFLNGYNIQIAV